MICSPRIASHKSHGSGVGLAGCDAGWIIIRRSNKAGAPGGLFYDKDWGGLPSRVGYNPTWHSKPAARRDRMTFIRGGDAFLSFIGAPPTNGFVSVFGGVLSLEHRNTYYKGLGDIYIREGGSDTLQDQLEGCFSQPIREENAKKSRARLLHANISMQEKQARKTAMFRKWWG